jgi:heme/copper-type cytochrome/quinol oxidase subunit 2
VVISVAQADGSVTPAPERVPVPLGSPVRLTVTSDVADEIHVHGYELEQPVAAGGSTTFRFTADQAGLFEVEAHETALQLLQLQVS